MEWTKSLALLLPLASWAGAPVALDECQSHCALGKGSDGETKVYCSCPAPRPPWVKPRLSTASSGIPAALQRSPVLQRMALRGESREHLDLVVNDSCRSRVEKQREHPRPAGEFISLLNSSQSSVCECVEARVHFPLSRICERTPGLEKSCRFIPVERAPAESGPLRDPQLEDYQACLAKAANRGLWEEEVRGQCEEAACKRPPLCDWGQELVNLAQEGDCCPNYACRDKYVPEKREEGGVRGAQ